MALIKCPECGKEMSDQATVCLNCGLPLNVKIARTYKGNVTQIDKRVLDPAFIICSVACLMIVVAMFLPYASVDDEPIHISFQFISYHCLVILSVLFFSFFRLGIAVVVISLLSLHDFGWSIYRMIKSHIENLQIYNPNYGFVFIVLGLLIVFIIGIFLIIKHSLMFPNCGMPQPNVVQTSKTDTNGEQAQGFQFTPGIILGLIGAFLILIGMFMPFVQVPLLGGINYTSVGKGIFAIIIVLLVAMGLLFTFLKAGIGTILASIGARILLCIDTIRVLNPEVEMRKLASAMVQTGIGMIMLWIGLILLLVSGFMSLQTKANKSSA